MLMATPGAASCVCTSCPHGPGFLWSVCAPRLHPSEGAVIGPAPEAWGENWVMPGFGCLGRSSGLGRSFNLWLLPTSWPPLSRQPLLLLSTVSTCGSRWRPGNKGQQRGGAGVVCGDPLVPKGMFLRSISGTSPNPEGFDFLSGFGGWSSVLVTPFADQITEAQGSQEFPRPP